MASNRDKRIKRKVRRSYIISTVSIALVLFLIGTVSYATLSAINAVGRPAENVVVSVEIADNLFENEKQVILNAINARPETASVEFRSQDEKISDGTLDVDYEIFGYNPLYDSYEVTLRREYAKMRNIDEFAEAMSLQKNVVYVFKPNSEVLRTTHQIISGVTIALLVFLVVLLCISVLLLNNTVRLAIYSKRYLITTMKLVGATKWYIMRPLLASALKQGFIAGAVASLMICATAYGIKGVLPAGIAVLGYSWVGIIVGTVVVLGIIITVGFSAMAINKFINMRSNNIHLY